MNKKSINDIIKGILEKSKSLDSITVCVGSGASISSGMPTWNELILDFVNNNSESLNIKADSFKKLLNDMDFSNKIELISQKIGSKQLIDYLKNIDDKLLPSELHRAIASIPAKAFVTTNFDSLLEKALLRNGKPYQLILGDTDLSTIKKNIVPVVKAYGSIQDSKNLIFSSYHYDRVLSSTSSLDNYMRVIFSTNLILFIGYSLSDQFLNIFERYRNLNNEMSNWYFLSQPIRNQLYKEVWENRGIRFIELNYDSMPDFIYQLSDLLLQKREVYISEKKPNQIFLSISSKNEAIRYKLAKILNDIGLEPVSILDQPSSGMTILEKFTKMIKESTYAIVYLDRETVEDRLSHGRSSRDNTMLELGYLLGLMGREKVILILDKQADLPSDLAGINFYMAEMEKETNLSIVIKDWINNVQNV